MMLFFVPWVMFLFRRRRWLFLISILCILLIYINYEVSKTTSTRTEAEKRWPIHAEENDESLVPTGLENALVKVNGKAKMENERLAKGKSKIAEIIENVRLYGMQGHPVAMLAQKKGDVKKFKRQGKISSNVCNAIDKDRPNWTIKYKSSNSGICAKIESQKWIKKVIFPNGTEVYRGCTKFSRKCRERSYFHKKLKIRINTPPCCLKHMVSILKNIVEGLTSFRVKYFLFGGGLIGWYRNKSVVPYDNDLDVIVDLRFWRSAAFKEFLRHLERKHGYFIRRRSWNKFKIYFSKENHNFVDLWPYSKKGNSYIRIKSSQWKIQHAWNILPLKKATFEGFEILIPRNVEQALNHQYGIGKWQNELKCSKKGKFGNCEL